MKEHSVYDTDTPFSFNSSNDIGKVIEFSFSLFSKNIGRTAGKAVLLHFSQNKWFLDSDIKLEAFKLLKSTLFSCYNNI